MKNTFLMKRILVIATLAVASHCTAYANVSYLNYGARRYVPAACYFSSPDIAAEEMPFLSSYTFCAANPINIIDPSGNRIIVVQHDGDNVELSYDYTNNEFYANGSYTDSYVDDVVNNLNKVNNGMIGHTLTMGLYNMDNTIKVSKAGNISKVGYYYNLDLIKWNTFAIYMTQNMEGNEKLMELRPAPCYVSLAHEIAHAFDDMSGNMDMSVWYSRPIDDTSSKSIRNFEKFAITCENYIRTEHNLPLRVAYGTMTSPKSAPGEIFRNPIYKVYFYISRFFSIGIYIL